MRLNFRRYLTFANVTAFLALFIAVGGTSYAAVTVTGRNVKDGSLTGRDLKDGSVTSKDVAGLTAADLPPNLPTGATGATGPRGAPGEAGPAGANGRPGADATNLWAVVQADGTLAAGSGVVSVQSCSSCGSYDVKFNRSVANCARIAVPGVVSNRQLGVPPEGGSVFTELSFDTSKVIVYPFSGGVAPAQQARAFHLAVFC
jgi:hypothetical protein